MKKPLFLFFVVLNVLFTVLTVSFFFAPDSNNYITPEQKLLQAQAWSGFSKIHVFLMLQLLIGSVALSLVGAATLLFFWAPSRYLLVAGTLGFFSYLLFGPGGSPYDYRLLLQLLIAVFWGGLSSLFCFGLSPRRLWLCILALALLCVVGFFGVQLITHVPLNEMVRGLAFKSSRYGMLFCLGLVLTQSLFGLPKYFFLSDGEKSTNEARGYVFASFVLASVLYVAAGLFLSRPLLVQPLYLISSPVLPFIMTAYGVSSWFSLDGEVNPFLLNYSTLAPESHLLFATILFQYLSLLAVVLITLAVKKAENRLVFLCAHFGFAIYWIPALLMFLNKK